MTGSGATRIALSDLVLGAELGGGGQGKVRAVEKRLINHAWPVVYKEYRPEALSQLRVDALERMVAFLPDKPPAVGQWLAAHTAWPAALVTEGPQVRGFLMRQIPDEYFITMPSGERKTAGFEFLLNSLTYVNKMVGNVSPRQVLGLLLAFADTLERLHGLGVVAGDLSPKNLLFSLSGPRPGCFLIDCDAMGLGGDWVLKPVQTPGWQLPDSEAPETFEGDRYKFALLAVRLFLHEQHGTDLTELRRTDEALADLAERGLSRNPADRPALSDWLDPLRRAFDSAPLTWPSLAQTGTPTTTVPHAGGSMPRTGGTAAGGTRPGGPRPAGSRTPRTSAVPRSTAPAAPRGAAGGTSSPGRAGAVLGWIVLGILALVVWQVAVHRDTGSSGAIGSGASSSGATSGGAADGGATGPPRTESAPADTREKQAAALHTLLERNTDRRSGVSDAVQSLLRCSSLQEDRRVFEDAADARAGLVRAVDELSLDQLSGDLATSLRRAWRSSEEADRAYVRVVDDVSGNCSASAVTGTSAWQDAASASADATAAKQAFVAAWNPLAREFALSTRAWTDL